MLAFIMFISWLVLISQVEKCNTMCFCLLFNQLVFSLLVPISVFSWLFVGLAGIRHENLCVNLIILMSYITFGS